MGQSAKTLCLRLEAIDVQSKFEPKRFASLRHPVPMMEKLDRLFKADGDEQTDHDRGNVDEEVFPSMNSLVRVYIEHCRCILLWAIGRPRGMRGVLMLNSRRN